MITAEAAKTISLRCRFIYLDLLIREAANKGKRMISLMGENIYLTEDEIKQLNELGYKVSHSESSKSDNTFDIISW